MLLDLKKLAFDLRLTQQDLTEVVGVAQSQISAMMNGKREIKEEHIKRLKERYGDVISKYFINPAEQCDATRLDNKSINPTNTQAMMDQLAMAMDYISTLKQQLVEKDELIRRLTAGQQTAADEVLSRRLGAVEEKQGELTDEH